MALHVLFDHKLVFCQKQECTLPAATGVHIGHSVVIAISLHIWAYLRSSKSVLFANTQQSSISSLFSILVSDISSNGCCAALEEKETMRHVSGCHCECGAAKGAWGVVKHVNVGMARNMAMRMSQCVRWWLGHARPRRWPIRTRSTQTRGATSTVLRGRHCWTRLRTKSHKDIVLPLTHTPFIYKYKMLLIC
jgi:hypothetical protein